MSISSPYLVHYLAERPLVGRAWMGGRNKAAASAKYCSNPAGEMISKKPAPALLPRSRRREGRPSA